jgi:hypothetical protein
MVWNEDQDAIYVLFADDKTPGWAFLPDEFEDGQPETDPSLVPPSGLYQPIRGFGLIWRNHSLPAGTPVRDRLGWATDREKEIQTAIQCDNRPQDAICYLGWPDGKILEMRNGIGTWSIYR